MLQGINAYIDDHAGRLAAEFNLLRVHAGTLAAGRCGGPM